MCCFIHTFSTQCSMSPGPAALLCLSSLFDCHLFFLSQQGFWWLQVEVVNGLWNCCVGMLNCVWDQDNKDGGSCLITKIRSNSFSAPFVTSAEVQPHWLRYQQKLESPLIEIVLLEIYWRPSTKADYQLMLYISNNYWTKELSLYGSNMTSCCDNTAILVTYFGFLQLSIFSNMCL